MGNYNHDEFVSEESAGGDGRGGGDASSGMRGSRLCGEVCCCELRVEEDCNCELCGVYGVRREVRGKYAGSLNRSFCGRGEAEQT